jgi:hypothetical protein
VATIAVWLLDPHAPSIAAQRAALKGISNLNMTSPRRTRANLQRFLRVPSIVIIVLPERNSSGVYANRRSTGISLKARRYMGKDLRYTSRSDG